jgi:hypothetical protein
MVLKVATYQNRVERAMNDKIRRSLYGAAAYALKVMKTKMKQRKTISSSGEFPSAHSGQLRDLIEFYVNAPMKSFIVGPCLFPGSKDTAVRSQTVPNLLNYGGMVTREYRKKSRHPVKRTQKYEPRPFVALTREYATKVFIRNLETYDLKE